MSYFETKQLASSEFQSVKSLLRSAGAPFAGWRVGGEQWESFTLAHPPPKSDESDSKE